MAYAVPEVGPSSQWCQRWTHGRRTLRHVSERGFQPEALLRCRNQRNEARRYTLEHQLAQFPCDRATLRPIRPRRGTGRRLRLGHSDVQTSAHSGVRRHG